MLHTLLVLAAVPTLKLILVPWLVDAGRSKGQRLTGFDRFAVGLAATPYLFVVAYFSGLLPRQISHSVPRTAMG